MSEHVIISDLKIPFPSAREAEIAYNSLRVDRDPRKDVEKTISVNDNILQVHFKANKTKFLRSAVGNFLDLVHLVMQTVEEFGPPME
ncbi:EKC/KEOPS complex subunit LAGE3-like isoform X2 [Amphiura filiformis]|uniref:EKC/KEOPS complex subunit LAGE3-like isoform X2 n=1 Tax=Amphiura filiformis TaxID=82378 RepID=UPI003B21C05E